MCADHCQRARWTGAQVRCAAGGAVHPQVRRQPISRAPATPCKNSQSCVQIIASEPDGQVSKSDVQQVALYTHKSGGSQLVVPRKPFPMTNKSLEKFMLWLDWTRTFNKYVADVVKGIAALQALLHYNSVLFASLLFKPLLYYSKYGDCVVAVQSAF